MRNTLPLAIIPAVKRKSHLPIVIDPSHGTGHAYMVPSMCRAAVAAGADGLLIEVHPDPEHALTDGTQSLTPEVFAKTMQEVSRVAEAVGRTVQGLSIANCRLSIGDSRLPVSASVGIVRDISRRVPSRVPCPRLRGHVDCRSSHR